MQAGESLDETSEYPVCSKEGNGTEVTPLPAAPEVFINESPLSVQPELSESYEDKVEAKQQSQESIMRVVQPEAAKEKSPLSKDQNISTENCALPKPESKPESVGPSLKNSSHAEDQLQAKRVTSEKLEIEEVENATEHHQTNKITKSKTEDDHNIQDDLVHKEDKWTKVWMWHTWISSQPSGEKKTDTIVSFMLYFLFLIIAFLPMYLVMDYKSTFTSTELVGISQSLLGPDAIVCPPKNACFSCSDQFQHYNFSYDVWWNADVLNFLNISEYDLNLLASTVQIQAFSEKTNSIPNQLIPYIERAKELVQSGYKGPDYESYEKTGYQFWNCSWYVCASLQSRFYRLHPFQALSRQIDNSSFDLNDMWHLIVKFPRIFFYFTTGDQGNLHQSYYPKTFQLTKYIEPKTTWVNNSYCLLFKNEKGYSIRSGKAWKGDEFTFEIDLEKAVSEFGWRYWIGYLFKQPVFLPHFQKMKKLFNFRVHLDFLTIKDYTGFSKKYTTCYTDISVLRNTGCNKSVLTEYTYAANVFIGSFMPNWLFPRRVTLYFTPSKAKLITKQNVYSSLAKFEIMSAIFCFFLGTSIYQIVLILLGFMSKKWIFFESTNLKVMICFFVLILSFILFYIDLNDHLQPKYSSQLVDGVGRHRFPRLLFFSSTAHSNFLNYTKLEELRVSLSLLQYIHIAGTGRYFSHTDSLSFPLNEETLKVGKEDMKKRLDIQSCDDSREELHKEYEALAVKLGIDPAAPAYHVLNKLSLDKCMLIQYCIINGVKHDYCCDQYFSYRPTRAQNSLVFESSHHFIDQDLGFPDIEIKFNDDIVFNQTSLHNYANYLGNYSKSSTQFWFSFQGFLSFTMNNFHVRTKFFKEGDASLIILSVVLSEEEIRKRVEQNECLNNSCYGQADYPGDSSVLTSALIRFKLCGCYICFNHTEMKKNLENQNKCCSPHKAIECLANPLLYYNKENPDCPTPTSTCSHPLPVKKMNGSEYCLKAYCPHIVAFKTNSTNCTEKINVQCECDPKFYSCKKEPNLFTNLRTNLCRRIRSRKGENIFIKTPLQTMTHLDAIYPNLDLDTTKDDLRQYGCNVNIEAFKKEPCSDIEYATYKVVQRYEGQTKQQGQVAIQLSRSSATNNILANRALEERSYNIMEILGFLLGAYGLFVGLDILSMIAAIIRFMLMHGLPLRKRLLDSSVAAEIHWMRLFKQFLPSFIKVSSKNKDSLEQRTKVQATYSKLCVVSAVILMLVGLALSLFAGSSKLFNEKEFNMDIVEEMNAKDFPSFAVCKEFDNSSSIPAQTKIGFEGIRCWVSMKEHSCTKVFDLQVFTGHYFCWVASDTSRFMYPDNDALSLDEFDFVFTINKTFPYTTWYGHISQLSSYTEIDPEIGFLKQRVGFEAASLEEEKKVFSYEEYRNLSCTFTQDKQLLCPYCTEQSFNSHQCCIYHQNVTTDFLKKKHQCPKVRYIEGNQNSFATNSLSWLKSSDIWEEIKPYRILALKRMNQYVTEATQTDRHSVAAKFAFITGYCDLFLGISLLSIGGAFTLWFMRYIQSILQKCISHV